jgi:hypothetical protein
MSEEREEGEIKRIEEILFILNDVEFIAILTLKLSSINNGRRSWRVERYRKR